MTKREENRYSMFVAVNNYLQDNSETVNQIPAFVEAVGEFNSIIPQIRAKDIEYIDSVKGATEAKEIAEDNMIDAILPVAASLKIYARRNDMPSLKEITTVTENKLKYMRDNDMLSRVKSIAAKANEFADALVNYGVTAEVLTETNNKITTYETANAGQDTSYADKSSLRRELTTLIKETDAILREELELFAEIFETTNPAFYNGFKSASVIKDM